ncbi:MAG: hypothetical protein KA764_21430 [Anaerolineales bacterium]|nr:hypothetical protein [Anaerolineales bacterium]
MSETVRHWPLDRYHAGVRLASLVWWAAVTAGLFFGGVGLAQWVAGEAANWLWLPWLIVCLLASQPLGRWGERVLQARWPSGRSLEAQGARLVLREPAGAQTFDLTQKVNYWRWCFQVRERRGGRVPNGYRCYALRLIQAVGAVEAGACVYAFLPPAAAEAVNGRYAFYELRRPQEPPLAAGVLGGRDPAFLAVEKLRWEMGAELEPADFQLLLEHLAARLPDFAGHLS